MSKLSVTEIDVSIGLRIQLRRKELQLTAAYLSEKIGISQQQLSRYERGMNKINVSHLFAISVCLETPISWFFLECEINTANKVSNTVAPYVTVQDADLQVRLHQVWTTLSRDQQRKLISLLDSFSL
ncbi:helix-turn-helix domain-containing protein [Marinomonas sp. 2405UD68-3]|uniref:helix-turn-helix domain-containing protein n=1 Tax=Marinomonas sp. 2405UD68-3 TaxID=3391835 RepID=UPI0039C94AC1